MKLSYRGVTYETESNNLDIDQGEIVGKYRGQNWRYKYPRHIPHLQPKIFLQYRGVAYCSIPNVKTSENLPNCACQVPITKRGKPIKQETENIHLDNIRRNLERRLKIAMDSGDHQLVNLLEHEYEQLKL